MEKARIDGSNPQQPGGGRVERMQDIDWRGSQVWAKILQRTSQRVYEYRWQLKKQITKPATAKSNLNQEHELLSTAFTWVVLSSG